MACSQGYRTTAESMKADCGACATAMKDGNPVSTQASPFLVEVIREEGLDSIRKQWEMLSAAAIEPNLFYEPWMLLPALKVIECGSEARFLLIWHQDQDHASADRLLVGFVPFIAKGQVKGLPVPGMEVLTHIYCTLGVPLLRRGFSKAALEIVFDWVRSSGLHVVVLRCLPSDGAFHHALAELLDSRSLVLFLDRRYTRALYRCSGDPQLSIAQHLSTKYQKQLRKKKDALAKEGELEFRQLSADDELSCWTKSFLKLEASGWKGTAGTALASAESHALFFNEVSRAARELNRLSMSGLWLNGKMIAGCSGFRAGDGIYLFKIAFDERYAKYSPGVLLQIECMRDRYDGAAWVDCCTTANHPVFPRIWMHRRTIEQLIVSDGSVCSDLFLSVLPAIIFVKRRFSKMWCRLAGKRGKLNEEEMKRNSQQEDDRA